MFVIPALRTQEAEKGVSKFEVTQGKRVSKTLSQKTSYHKPVILATQR
jgi:hypothetical protein